MIITRTRNGSDDIKILGKDNLWFLAQTNYDNWKKQPIYDDRLTPCIECMQTKGSNEVTFGSLFNVLSSRPMLNKVNWSSAFDPEECRHVLDLLVDCLHSIDGSSNRPNGIVLSVLSGCRCLVRTMVDGNVFF